jgi:hypothetical protein
MTWHSPLPLKQQDAFSCILAKNADDDTDAHGFPYMALVIRCQRILEKIKLTLQLPEKILGDAF